MRISTLGSCLVFLATSAAATHHLQHLPLSSFLRAQLPSARMAVSRRVRAWRAARYEHPSPPDEARYVYPLLPALHPSIAHVPPRASYGRHRPFRQWRRTENPRTTRLYDRTKERLTQDEVERGCDYGDRTSACLSDEPAGSQ
jgi:hypothetical protein